MSSESSTPVFLRTESPKQLLTILIASDGNLVLDGGPNHGAEKRPFYRYTAGKIQVAKVLSSNTDTHRVESGTIREEKFIQRLEHSEYFKLWPLSDSPFSAVSDSENSESTQDESFDSIEEETPLHDGLEL